MTPYTWNTCLYLMYLITILVNFVCCNSRVVVAVAVVWLLLFLSCYCSCYSWVIVVVIVTAVILALDAVVATAISIVHSADVLIMLNYKRLYTINFGKAWNVLYNLCMTMQCNLLFHKIITQKQVPYAASQKSVYYRCNQWMMTLPTLLTYMEHQPIHTYLPACLNPLNTIYQLLHSTERNFPAKQNGSFMLHDCLYVSRHV